MNHSSIVATYSDAAFYMDLNNKQIANFWSKVNKFGPLPDQSIPHYLGLDQCWEWTGCKREGYGRFNIRRLNQSSHRISWEIHNAKISGNLFVLHKCDNRACVNPSHLFIGDNQLNMSDKSSKGRCNSPSGKLNGSYTKPERRPTGERNGQNTKPQNYPKGSSVYNSKLTEEDVFNMRSKYKSGQSQVSLAKEYKIRQGSVSRIIRNTTWKHVKPN